LTLSFTSTSTLRTVPESSLPIVTERVGCKVPLAETVSVRLPRAPPRHIAGGGVGRLAACQAYTPPAATSKAAASHSVVLCHQRRRARPPAAHQACSLRRCSLGRFHRSVRMVLDRIKTTS
jgi:hypothetical protein